MDSRYADRIGAAIALLAPGLVLALGAILAGIGVTPWVLWIGAVVSIVVGLGSLIPLSLAVAIGLTTPIALWIVIARAVQPVELPLDLKAMASLLLIGVLGLTLSWARRGFASRTDVPVRSVAIALSPLIVLVAGLVAHVRLVGAHAVTWAMHNDAVWNTVQTRFVVQDSGLSSLHPNPSPATAALMAAATSVGRADVDSAELLLHDTSRQAQFWLLVIFSACVLAALLIAPRTYGYGRCARVVIILAATFVPASWFAAGNAIQFGFINASIALTLLLACWIAWDNLHAAPRSALFGLSVCATALLATWAPLVIVPAALLLASSLDLGLGWWTRLRIRDWLAIVAIASPVTAYALMVTLPDLVAEGSALAADGGIFPIRPEHVMLACLGAVLVAVTSGLTRRTWRDALGIGAIIVGSACALGYLVLQRRDAAFLWGYYPAKFGWLIMTLLLIVGGAILVHVIGLGRQWKRTLVTVAALAVVAAMALLPPTRATLIPFAGALGFGPLSAPTHTADLLFSLSSTSHKNLVSNYNGAADDGFVNSWLLQLHSSTGSDPVRTYSYVLDSADASNVCQAATVWGGAVRVHTRDSATAVELASCAAVDDVVVD